MFMFNDLVKKCLGGWQQQLLLTSGLSFFVAFFVLDQLMPLHFISLWQSFFYRSSAAIIAIIYLQSITTGIYTLFLFPFATTQALAHIARFHNQILPVIKRLITEFKTEKPRSSGTNKRTKSAWIFSLASLFSPRHGAYSLHAITQSLLYYSG